MKLISMTDFVLEQTESLYEKNKSKLIHNIVNYAQFLKKPLTLGMFVPCDLEGNIIKLDTEYKEYSNSWSSDEIKHYKQAQERVLFKNCSIIKQGENTIVYHKDFAIWVTWTNRIVEDLLKENIELTESVIKQFM